MKDSFGRTIDYIRISVTDRCNLRCQYCMPEDGVPSYSHADILTFDEIIRIVTIFASLGIKKIKVTGGEPLVRKNVISLISKLHQIDGIEDITLTTNGVLLRDSVEALVASGITSINISLDTLNASDYLLLTRRDHLSDVMASIEEAKKHRVKLKINTVIIDKNQDFVSIAKLSKDNNIHVRFIEMMPIGEGDIKNISSDYVFNLLSNEFGKLKQYDKKLGNGPAVYYRAPGFKGNIGFISAISHKFCETCNRVRLTSQGFLKTCLQYDHGIDLKKLIRSEKDDDYIRNEIIKTLASKPRSHHFETAEPRGKDKKKMFQIGG